MRINLTAFLAALLVAGCGGGADVAEPGQPPQSASTRVYQPGLVTDTDPADTPAQVFRLYRAAFGRESDVAGLGYHIGHIETLGLTLADVSANFIRSPEFSGKYGQLNTTQFVTQLYANVLGRAPDAAGLAFHSDNIASGRVSRAQVLIGFSEAPENKSMTAATIARGITFAPLPPPAPAGTNLLPSTLYYAQNAQTGNAFELKANNLSLSGQKRANGSEQLVVRSAEGNFTASYDPATGSTVVKDEAEKVTIVSEAGPKGTVMRAYSSTGAFLVGYYAQVGANGQRTLWRMAADGNTTPGNLKSGRPFPAAPASPRSADASVPMASSDTCYGIMGDITGSGASYATETGEAMDQDDAPPSARRVGRLGKFLGSLWSKVPRLCPDAPDPVSDTTFAKETVLEAIKAAGPKGVRALLEKYQSYKEFADENSRLAAALRQILARLSPSERTAVGAAVRALEADNPLTADPKLAVESSRTSIRPTAVYLGDSLSCVDSTLVGSTREFINGCSLDTRVSWCQSGGSICSLTNSTVIARGSRYRFSATYFQNYSAIWYAACQAVHEGRAVILQETGTGYFTCSYSTY